MIVIVSLSVYVCVCMCAGVHVINWNATAITFSIVYAVIGVVISVYTRTPFLPSYGFTFYNNTIMQAQVQKKSEKR